MAKRTPLWTLVVILASGCQSDPPAPPPPRAETRVAPVTSASVVAGAVFVDRSEPAYTVFLRIPEGLPPDNLARMQEWLAAHPESGVVGLSAVGAETRARVQKDDYPECGVSEGIVALLEKYPASPFGVTWNGGIALTFNDYQHTKALLERWKKQPSAPTRPGPREWDPIHPQAHLGPLLGR